MAGVVFHVLPLVADDVLVAQAREGAAQQQEGQEDHAGHHGKLPPVEAFHWPVTSNL